MKLENLRSLVFSIFACLKSVIITLPSLTCSSPDFHVLPAVNDSALVVEGRRDDLSLKLTNSRSSSKIGAQQESTEHVTAQDSEDRKTPAQKPTTLTAHPLVFTWCGSGNQTQYLAYTKQATELLTLISRPNISQYSLYGKMKALRHSGLAMTVLAKGPQLY